MDDVALLAWLAASIWREVERVIDSGGIYEYFLDLTNGIQVPAARCELTQQPQHAHAPSALTIGISRF